MKNSRWLALDSTRGLAVLGMVLVVSPGSWGHRLSWLDHAAWNGWTPADMVMPLFLFCVGLALGMKASSQHFDGFDLSKVFIRTLALFGIGLGLNWIEAGSISTIRLPGILQRIALCYFLAALTLHTLHKPRSSGLTIATVLMLLCGLNYFLMNGAAYASAPSGELTYKDNLAALIDRTVFGVQHLWVWGRDESGNVVYDPDGLLSSIFATANVLAGVLVFTLKKKLLIAERPKHYWLTLILLAISLYLLAQRLDSHGILINKKLWSLSFTLLSISCCIGALLIFELIHFSNTGSALIAKTNLLSVFGTNAILAFILSTLMLIYSGAPLITHATERIGIQTFVFNKVNSVITEPYTASLFCAGLVCFSLYLALLPFYKTKIFIRL